MAARAVIRSLLTPDDVVVSGGCHLGGIDIWAEEESVAVGCATPVVFKPITRSWGADGGFQHRNIQIATASDIVHVIVVDKLPKSYKGMRFDYCYHCKTSDHIKSGGCWTGKYAEKLGKSAKWHIIK